MQSLYPKPTSFREYIHSTPSIYFLHRYSRMNLECSLYVSRNPNPKSQPLHKQERSTLFFADVPLAGDDAPGGLVEDPAVGVDGARGEARC
jgi:hypothetical protein